VFFFIASAKTLFHSRGGPVNANVGCPSNLATFQAQTQTAHFYIP